MQFARETLPPSEPILEAAGSAITNQRRPGPLRPGRQKRPSLISQRPGPFLLRLVALWIVPPTISLTAAVEKLAPEFLSACTNVPTIARLVLETMFVPATAPTIFEFRCKQGAFFARRATAKDDYSRYDASDSACGRWNEEYWFYSGRPRKHGLLYTDSSRDQAQTSTAYLAQRDFESWFSYYANWGISSHGIAALTLENGCLRSTDPVRKWKTIACLEDLVVSNGLPTRAHVIRQLTPALNTEIFLHYSYDTNIAPFPYPAQIEAYDGKDSPDAFSYRLRVLEFDLPSPARPLSRGMFIPAPGTWTSNAVKIVYTNHQEYAAVGNVLTPLTGDPVRQRAELHDRRRPPHSLLTILVIALSLVPLVAWGIAKFASKHQRTT